MAIGINGLLNMGTSALFASQGAIQVTGNNVANVNTVGYSRQALRLQESITLDYRPGQIGTGVDAKEVYRYFDRFIESSYLDKFSKQRRYEEEYSLMRSVESLFNESNNNPGVSSQFTAMLDAWAKLADEPDSQPVRAALLEKMKNFAASVRGQDESLEALQRQMDEMISKEVDKANTLIQQIADLNLEIKTHTVHGQNNANTLMDQRDRLVRELSGILDISVDDRGGGDYTVTTAAGFMLVQDDIPFSLEFMSPRVENNLVHNSNYGGTVAFDGTDGYEYTLQVVTGGIVDTTGNPATNPNQVAQYRVSLDGGKTWLKDDNGNDVLYYATNKDYKTDVKDLDVHFTDTTTPLTVGDKFLLTPKSDVYWLSPTTEKPIDISTQVYQDGTENGLRIQGGSLAGYLEFRDYKIGEYRDRLAAFSDAVTWEINRIHSQGSGLEKLNHVLGDFRVIYTDVPLGSDNAGFKWADRLQAGNITLALYDGNGDPVMDNPGVQALVDINFDPETDSLEDFVAKINSQNVMVGGASVPLSNFINASIVDNRLQITSNNDPGTGKPYAFGFTNDTSGILAGLGVNTVFNGETPGDLGINEGVVANTNLINAGRVNGGAEGNSGDNITARAIADLSTKGVKIGVGKLTTTQPLNDYYATIVTKVGSDTQSLMLYAASERTMAEELNARRDEISGVNLDEEMSNLIKFQASYKAAAKLITTADQMLQTLLTLKQ